MNKIQGSREFVLTLSALISQGSNSMSIDIPASDTPDNAAAKSTQQPEVIILLLGSFDAALAPQVRSVFARALIPVALLTKAMIVDNGSSEGIAALMGQAAQQVDQAPMLLGILSPGVPGPEPNHTEVLRMPPEWPDPAKSAFQIAAALAKDATNEQKPVIGLLAGGGNAEKLIALRCARRAWPLLIMQGAQGIGDALLTATSPPADTQPTPLADPDLQEIVDTASILPFSLTGNTDDIKRALLGPIQKPRDVLADAWSRYDDLDRAAIDKQRLFRYTQGSILILTVIATLLAIVITRNWATKPVSLPWVGRFDVHFALHVLMILVPIIITILVGFNARFREGNKWILLRSAAEAIKREIFRYRSRTGTYSPAQSRQALASMSLAANIKDITGNLVQSEVNRSSLPKPENDETRSADGKRTAARNDSTSAETGKPLRLKFLRPDEYLSQRVDDQIGYFDRKTRALYRQLKWMVSLILIFGGLGTFLAAMSHEVWVALTAALATALTNKLEIDQVENSLVQYNMALTNLQNIETWWKGLSPWEKSRQKNLDLLVDQTETTLAHETAGWVQQMQSTLDKLTEKESTSNQKTDSTPNQ